MIDTQGMSIPGSGDVGVVSDDKPMPVKRLTVFTEMEREELKEIINEVLDERARKEIPYYEDDSWLYRGTY